MLAARSARSSGDSGNISAMGFSLNGPIRPVASYMEAVSSAGTSSPFPTESLSGSLEPCGLVSAISVGSGPCSSAMPARSSMGSRAGTSAGSHPVPSVSSGEGLCLSLIDTCSLVPSQSGSVEPCWSGTTDSASSGCRGSPELEMAAMVLGSGTHPASSATSSPSFRGVSSSNSSSGNISI